MTHRVKKKEGQSKQQIRTSLKCKFKKNNTSKKYKNMKKRQRKKLQKT